MWSSMQVTYRCTWFTCARATQIVASVTIQEQRLFHWEMWASISEHAVTNREYMVSDRVNMVLILAIVTVVHYLFSIVIKYCTSIVFCFFVLYILIIIQMVSLYKDPKGENMFVKKDNTNKVQQFKATRMTVDILTDQGTAEMPGSKIHKIN